MAKSFIKFRCFSEKKTQKTRTLRRQSGGRTRFYSFVADRYNITAAAKRKQTTDLTLTLLSHIGGNFKFLEMMVWRTKDLRITFQVELVPRCCLRSSNPQLRLHTTHHTKRGTLIRVFVHEATKIYPNKALNHWQTISDFKIDADGDSTFAPMSTSRLVWFWFFSQHGLACERAARSGGRPFNLCPGSGPLGAAFGSVRLGSGSFGFPRKPDPCGSRATQQHVMLTSCFHLLPCGVRAVRRSWKW